MADILSIAEEDNALHGDLKPGLVRVGSNGSVSIEGYGVGRRGGRAPEGHLLGTATDVYGLGVVLHAVLSSGSLGAVPRERDAHDDHIVERLLSIDWGEMSGKRWIDPVVHFLCSMLAHSPQERPAALDVANILGEVAEQMPGASLGQWAQGFASGQPSVSPVARSVPSSPYEEDLAGPQSLGQPVSQTGAFGRRQAGRAKGECTAFWSREKIAAMLTDDESAAAPSPAPRPRDGRRATPAPPVVPPIHPESVTVPGPLPGYPDGTPDLPDATITGKPADKELQKVIESFRSKNTGGSGGAPGVRAPAPPERTSWDLDASTPTRSATDAPMTAPTPPPPPVDPAITQLPEEALRPAPPRYSGSVAAVGRAPSARVSPPPGRSPVEKSAVPWTAIAVIAAAVIVSFSMVILAGVIWYMKSADADESIDTIAAAVDTGSVDVATEEKPPEKAKVKRKETDRERRERRERRARREAERAAKSSSASKADTTKKPQRRGATGTFVVQFKSPGTKARLECGDGQVFEFIGTTRRTFGSETTCLVRIGAAAGAVRVREPAVVRCTDTGAGKVSCRRS